MTTIYQVELPDVLFENRVAAFIGQFYKILPLKESGEPSLGNYISSLEREMLGCQSLLVALNNDADYLALLSILQYLSDHDCEVSVVKSDVFKAIGILKRMQRKLHKQAG